MRNDIVAGAHFPDYELTDHTATQRKLSELQGTDPMIVVLAEASAQRIAARMKGLSSYTVKWK
jgi:peroxiredoxin